MSVAAATRVSGGSSTTATVDEPSTPAAPSKTDGPVASTRPPEAPAALGEDSALCIDEPLSRVDEVFVTWSLSPTGIGFLDTIIDVLTKIILSPFLFLIAIADAMGARLFDRIHNWILFAIMGHEPDDVLRYFRHKPDTEVAYVIQRLARSGDLQKVFGLGDAHFRDDLLALVLTKVRDPRSLALLADGCLRWTEEGCDEARRRITHRAIAVGVFSDYAAMLTGLQPGAASLSADLRADAAAFRQPLIIGHRGSPGTFAENTLPSFQRAIDDGAEGVEIDLCLTRDGEIVLWHDDDPDGVVSIMRQSGLEPGQAYHPVVPPVGSSRRRAVHEQTLAEFERNHGYARNNLSGLLSRDRDVKPIRLTEFVAWALRERRCQRVYLDTKLPENASPAMLKAYADRLKELLGRPELASRCVVLSPFPRVLAGLRRELGETFEMSLDTEIVTLGPDPDKVRGLADGIAQGNGFVSVGMPRLGVDGRETYNEVLFRQEPIMRQLGSERPKLLAWTLNSQRDIEDAMSTGAVDEILTDDVALAVRLRRRAEEARRQGAKATHRPVTLHVPIPVIDARHVLMPTS